MIGVRKCFNTGAIALYTTLINELEKLTLILGSLALQYVALTVGFPLAVFTSKSSVKEIEDALTETPIPILMPGGRTHFLQNFIQPHGTCTHTPFICTPPDKCPPAPTDTPETETRSFPPDIGLIEYRGMETPEMCKPVALQRRSPMPDYQGSVSAFQVH
jgi:hypothetical protein